MNRKQRRAKATSLRRPPGDPAQGPNGRARRQAASQWADAGRALQARGKMSEAVTAFRKAVSAYPQAPALHANLAAALRAAGDVPAAVAAYRQAIRIDSRIPALHNNLGNALLELGDTGGAQAAYRQALKLDPDYADAHSNLGLGLRETGQLDDAVAACRRAVGLAPQRPDLHANLVTVLDGSGRLEEASAALRDAIRLCPGDVRLRCQSARLHVESGDMGAAETALREALAIDPTCAAAFFELSGFKRFTADDPDILEMQRLSASSPQMPPADRIHLHFALAKALEDAGRYDESFGHLERGNALVHKRLPYDRTAQAHLVETIASVFDDDLLERLSGAGDPSTVPVFVVGMPRSGTTLVERIIGSHPKAHGAGELRHLNDIARGSGVPGDPAAAMAGLAKLDAARCRAMGEEYLGRVKALAPEAARIVDKMPSNFLRVGLIGIILPNARIIHCRRDPADTCLSCYGQYFRRGQAFAYDLRALGHYYGLYAQLMDHWHAVLPGRILDVDYEALVADPEVQTRRLLKHCGLSWDRQCLQFHASPAPVRTASASQVRKPVYRSSVARWRRYESHLGPLLDALANGR